MTDEREDTRRACDTCEGSGRVEVPGYCKHYDGSIEHGVMVDQECPDCRGDGWVDDYA